MYARHIGNFETIAIRVYTGAGENRPYFDYENIRARVTGYDPAELAGPIIQGDRKIIALAEDVESAGVPLPLQNGANWKVIVEQSKELQLKVPNNSTRRLGGVVVAYEIAGGG